MDHIGVHSVRTERRAILITSARLIPSLQRATVDRNATERKIFDPLVAHDSIDWEFEFYEYVKSPKIHDLSYENFKTVNFKIYKVQIITLVVAKFQQTLCR